MSYILDALRRAERERRAGKSPGMESLSDGVAEVAARLPVGIWVLAILTVLLAAAALLLSLRHRPQAAPSVVVASPSTVVAAPLQTLPMPAVDTSLQEPALPDDRESSPTIANGEELSSLDDLSADEDSPDTSRQSILITPGKHVVSEANNALATTARTLPSATGSRDKPISIDVSSVPRLTDMPEAYRAQFPSFSLDVHFYDADAARSWVMIDGQRYREGDSLPTGPRIVRIVEAGVIYESSGQMVLVQNR